MEIKEIKNFVNEKAKEYRINTIVEYNGKKYVFMESKQGVEFDIPVFVFTDDVAVLDRTDKEVFDANAKGKVIYTIEDFDPDEEDDYEWENT